MLGISSLLKNTKKDLKTLHFCQWQKDELNFTVTSSDDCSRGEITTLPSQLAERACKISWQQSISGFFSVLFKRCYNRLFVLPYSTIPFYSPLSTTILLQFWIFSFPTTSLTSSSHLTLCLPTLTATDYSFRRTFLSIFTIRPIHLIFCAFIYLTICARLVSNSICSLVLTFQLPIIWWLPC